MSVYNLLLGLGSGFVFNVTIASNVSNYDLYTQATAAGWNGTTPLNSTVTINSGVEVTSTSTSLPAFQINNIPTNSSLTLINNGYIVGKGGRGVGKGWDVTNSVRDNALHMLTAPAYASGGLAFSTTYPVNINNGSGVIGGGGGAGGAGGTGSGDCSCSSCGGGFATGGLGVSGGGAGYGISGFGYQNWQSNQGGYYNGYTSAAGTLTAGGSGVSAAGASGSLGTAGSSGTGGAPCGQSGIAGGGTGGAAGACTSGIGFITWIATGNRYGALN